MIKPSSTLFSLPTQSRLLPESLLWVGKSLLLNFPKYDKTRTHLWEEWPKGNGKVTANLSLADGESLAEERCCAFSFKSYYERHMHSVNFQVPSSFSLKSHGAEPALLG